jgi:endosialidase-like protein
MRPGLLSKYSFTRLAIVIAISLGATTIFGQTTSFTYQGRLTDGGTAANGNYDLQFALWDSLSGGGQVGSTQTLNTVAVSNGVFTVSLDFGASAFNGAPRFLEISARPSGGGAFTLLSPRQQITSTPYAVRSLNATTADSVPNTGLSPGSGNYIQNSTSPQSSSNFNITGNGSANVINATTQYNLNGVRILSNAGSENLFAGANAGSVNTTGVGNSFFGSRAGRSNSTGTGNDFFGDASGASNTEGNSNSFFGDHAGALNTTGSDNSFFGESAGFNASGSFNTFVGRFADFINVSPSGNRNTLLGANAKILTGGQFSPDNATAIGANARVDQANALVLGSINGINGATADTNVGIGTTAPTARLSVVAIGHGARLLHLGTERSWVFRQFGTGAETALELTGNDPNNNNKNFLINTQGFVGIGTTAPTATLSVNGTANKPGGGSWATFSDERLKIIKGHFTPGLHAVMQLQPLRYEYKRNNALNLNAAGEYVGFSAQAVQKIIPEAVTLTERGYLLVNNDPILWATVNAVKEQQAQIEQQQKLIEQQHALTVRQQQQLNALKTLVCRSHRRARVCQ